MTRRESLPTLVCELLAEIHQEMDPGQRKIFIDELYCRRSVVLTVFQGLSSLSQLLLIHAAATRVNEIHTLPVTASQAYGDDAELVGALEQLVALGVITAATPGINADNSPSLTHDNFTEHIRNYLFGPAINDSTQQEDVSAQRLVKEKDVAFLNDYAMKRWDSVLSFITQNHSIGKRTIHTTTNDIFLVLQFSSWCASLVNSVITNLDIIEMNEDRESQGGNVGFRVTPDGFNFLLMDLYDQIRVYLMHYLRYIHHSYPVENFVNFLALVCCVQNHQEAQPFSLAQVYPSAAPEHIRHLREIGLVYRRNSSAQHVVYTPNAIKALGLSTAEASHTLQDNTIMMVLETNLRLYVYNPTELILSLVALFCEVLTVFPDMSVCRLTRESTQRAFSAGITSQQIVNFIWSHMERFLTFSKHTAGSSAELVDNSTTNTTSLLPPTVVDQLVLWEKERNRVTHAQALLLDNFKDEIAFNNALNTIVSVDNSQLLFYSTSKKIIVISTDDPKLCKIFSKE